MKLLPHFVRIATLAIASLLLIIAASALSPVCANDLQPLTDAERYVLQKLQEGQGADLEDRFPSELRVLRGSFVAALLTNRDYRSGASLYTIWIRKGVIIGELDLRGKDIPYDTFLDNCTFKDNVYLTRSHFVQVLDLSGSDFLQDAYFSGANIGYDFVAEDCSFQSDLANFERLRTDRSFRIGGSTFKSIRTSFEGLKVGGRFTADKAIFRSKDVSFAEMRVDGDFSVQGCTFDFDKTVFEKKCISPPKKRAIQVSASSVLTLPISFSITPPSPIFQVLTSRDCKQT